MSPTAAPLDYSALKQSLLTSPDTVYIADGTDDLEWFLGHESGVDYLVTTDAYCDYYDGPASSAMPTRPAPARIALIGILPVRSFHLHADGNRSSLTGRRGVGKGSAALEDVEPSNKQSPFKTAYKNLSSIARIPLPATTHFSQALGAFETHDGLPSIRMEHDFFVVRLIHLSSSCL